MSSPTPASPRPSHHRPLLALVLRLNAVVALATLYALVKYAGEQGLALPEIMFWRQFVPALALPAWLAATGRLGHLRTTMIRAHGLRSLTGMIGMVANFGAAMLLPLAVATTFGFTTPLFAVVLGALVFREATGPWRWGAVALGFAGVLVIAPPGLTPISPFGAFVGLSAALLVALVSFQIRGLGRTEHPVAIVFYFSLFGSLLMLPVQPFVVVPHPPEQWALLVAIGAIGMVGQLLLTASLRFGAVTSVIVMDYTSLIWSTLFGWAIWDALPPHSTWLGAPLVIAAGLLVTWREHRLARQPSPAAAIEGE